MIKVGDEIELKIEKLVAGGEGLARFEERAVFVENTAPDDLIFARVTQVNSNLVKAEIIDIIEPSPSRIKPKCAMAKICGGCEWQHVDYETQLRQKRQIVQETLKKFLGEHIEVKRVIPSPKIYEFRTKIQYPATQTKVSKRILAGYYKKKTHELINIKHCEIQPPVLDGIIEDVKAKAQELGIYAYEEKRHSGELRHIILRWSEAFSNCLLVLVVNSNSASKEIVELLKFIYEKYEIVAGCLVNFNERKTNVIMGKETNLICGEGFYKEKLEDITYKIGAKSFFQVNPGSAVNILNVAKKMILENTIKPRILDAYSGVGTFGIWMSDIANEVFCVEEVEEAAQLAQENAELNSASNLTVKGGDVSKIFEELKAYKKEFDVIILDPPRKGVEENALIDLLSFNPQIIIYVSCNAATLSRDLKFLHKNGYKTEYVQPVDMFCHTHHIESVAMIKLDR